MPFIVNVRVKPRSKRPRVEPTPDGGLVVHLRSPPVDGKANEELIDALALYFSAKKSQVKIKSGLSSRNKIVEVDK